MHRRRGGGAENGTPYKKRYRTVHVRGVAEAMTTLRVSGSWRGAFAVAGTRRHGPPPREHGASAVTTVEETAVEKTPPAPEVRRRWRCAAGRRGRAAPAFGTGE